jgi:hypothetical protein
MTQSKLPKDNLHPYLDSQASDKEAPLSQEYKGTASGVGCRESILRKSKNFINDLRDSTLRGSDDFESIYGDSDGEEEGDLGGS